MARKAKVQNLTSDQQAMCMELLKLRARLKRDQMLEQALSEKIKKGLGKGHYESEGLEVDVSREVRETVDVKRLKKEDLKVYMKFLKKISMTKLSVKVPQKSKKQNKVAA